MGRRATGPAPGNERPYVPEAYDNHEDPMPVVVVLTTATELDRRRYNSTIRVLIELDVEGRVVTENGKPKALEVRPGDMEAATLKLFEANVVRVENYMNAGGDPIVTGAELATHGEPDIVNEVREAIMEGLSLSVPEKKTSAEQPHSSPARPGNSDGTAASAGAPAPISSAGAAPAA